MSKTKTTTSFGTFVAIGIYYFLPRMQMMTASFGWNLFFNFRNSCVVLITLGMLVVTFQKSYTNKFQNVNLNQMVVGMYILYLLATIFCFMLLEFI
ncbi:hypothetical protein [Enterococcus rivorum]|uniref:Uncharacterized protein n=1 Tax=Enterococcus rivorum TaxID=762845 RepID=A0A1E5L1B3_9ENTE|nr:hypothetical protein [Enterococcus rivorum]MBP2098609.1 putative membrane protein YqjE [Enterococcus rivorum]OEH83885.1 hypothetical protein BCR26_07755 [Enterococcus rivorum]